MYQTIKLYICPFCRIEYTNAYAERDICDICNHLLKEKTPTKMEQKVVD